MLLRPGNRPTSGYIWTMAVGTITISRLVQITVLQDPSVMYKHFLHACFTKVQSPYTSRRLVASQALQCTEMDPCKTWAQYWSWNRHGLYIPSLPLFASAKSIRSFRMSNSYFLVSVYVASMFRESFQPTLQSPLTHMYIKTFVQFKISHNSPEHAVILI